VRGTKGEKLKRTSSPLFKKDSVVLAAINILGLKHCVCKSGFNAPGNLAEIMRAFKPTFIKMQRDEKGH